MKLPAAIRGVSNIKMETVSFIGSLKKILGDILVDIVGVNLFIFLDREWKALWAHEVITILVC